MPCQATLNQLVEVLNAALFNWSDYHSSILATGIATDSRTIQPGQVFVALRGGKFDGHDFVEAAIAQGASAAIVDHQFSVSSVDHLPLLQVPDTLAAYQAIAHWWRNQFQIPIIGITGSVGKTTTKELVAAVLAAPDSSDSPSSAVLKTQANYNNEIGVPKTLLGLSEQHRFAVIEMGMRGSGEVALLAQIARPTIALITNVGTAHLERLGSEEAIARAECESLLELGADGMAILNHDDARLMATAADCWQGKTVTFGFTGGDLQGELLDHTRLKLGDRTFPLPLPGRHNALNYLAALTVAQVLGLDWTPLQAGISVSLPGGRAKRHELANDILLLDETYNAGVESMIATLHLLAQTPGQRRIAVLGTMRELGSRSPEFHQQVGETVAQLQLDHLLILADEPEASALATGAATVPSHCFSNHADLISHLTTMVQAGDRLLFKASRSVGLDQVVTGLLDQLGATVPKKM